MTDARTSRGQTQVLVGSAPAVAQVSRGQTQALVHPTGPLVLARVTRGQMQVLIGAPQTVYYLRTVGSPRAVLQKGTDGGWHPVRLIGPGT